MNSKIFSFLAACLFLFSCNTEGIPPQSDGLDFQITTDEFDPTALNNRCMSRGCVPDYTYPDPMFGPISWIVTYDSNMTIDEIECKRQEFFNCFGAYLRMSVLQSSDPYVDNWTTIWGRPHTAVTTALCTDPETGTNVQCN